MPADEAAAIARERQRLKPAFQRLQRRRPVKESPRRRTAHGARTGSVLDLSSHARRLTDMGGELRHDSLTWSEFFEDPELCCFCNEPLDDRRYAVGLVIRRSWVPGSVEYRFCHIECLRKTMHHESRLW